jgi:Na+-transporting NADH:ubiquinone oxidoreductase subunit C
MNKESTKYTFMFALIICVVCSFLLALLSEGLRTKRERNEEYDVKKHILSALDLRAYEELDVLDRYQRMVEEVVIDENGNIVDGKRSKDIIAGEKQYPLYIGHQIHTGKIISYAFPVYGKGLWSTIYGFLALEADATTIRGITFYKHGETPGLGGEVGAKWFQQNFKGKKIYDAMTMDVRPVQVIKGRVADKLKGRDAAFAVDGITGATITSRGVSKFLDEWIRVYEPYFRKVR